MRTELVRSWVHGTDPEVILQTGRRLLRYGHWLLRAGVLGLGRRSLFLGVQMIDHAERLRAEGSDRRLRRIRSSHAQPSARKAFPFVGWGPPQDRADSDA
jgi:hypothetical protein